MRSQNKELIIPPRGTNYSSFKEDLRYCHTIMTGRRKGQFATVSSLRQSLRVNLGRLSYYYNFESLDNLVNIVATEDAAGRVTFALVGVNAAGTALARSIEDEMRNAVLEKELT